jgi:hypothetical protein
MGAVHESFAISRRRTLPEGSLGSTLERDRLERRAARVRLVIGALRDRADARYYGATPRPLGAAIEDFGRELAELERRLGRAGRQARTSLPA